jgi:hypothetical protein
MKLSLLVAAALLAVGPASITCASSGWRATGYAACCKVCHKGKACGDSCIARDKTCHKGKGCACDG